MQRAHKARRRLTCVLPLPVCPYAKHVAIPLSNIHSTSGFAVYLPTGPTAGHARLNTHTHSSTLLFNTLDSSRQYCWESARFSQPIIGLAETIDDRLRNRFVGHHFQNSRAWTVWRGNDISHHSIRDTDQNLSNVDVVLYRRRCDIILCE